MGADIVDVNVGCPVPKIAKHNAGCSLMREPEHAARVIAAMARAVRIPVTVKMRAGWDDSSRNAPDLARRGQDAGAAAVTIHGRTAEQSYTGLADWDLVARVADALDIPVFGSGDCVEPEQITERLRRNRLRSPLAKGLAPIEIARHGDVEHRQSNHHGCDPGPELRFSYLAHIGIVTTAPSPGRRLGTVNVGHDKAPRSVKWG
jgi:hypothetical protein